MRYGQDLEEVVLRYPDLFREPKWEPGEAPKPREKTTYTDEWGVVYESVRDGISGEPKGHPLADWSALETYQAPDPDQYMNWDNVKAGYDSELAEGRFSWGPGASFFERLQWLRGPANLYMDLAESENPELQRMIDLVLAHNLKLVLRGIAAGPPDFVGFGDDLGSQRAPLMSPATFRRWLKPGYTAMWQPCRAAGCQVQFHTDGNIIALVDDLIEAGLTVLNPQAKVNTFADMRETIRGRAAIFLSLDIQGVMIFGNRQDIFDHVREAIMTLGSRRGGLMLSTSVYDDCPLENVTHWGDAMREYKYLHLDLPD
jgi:uroporphyrinogen decarboxylase